MNTQTRLLLSALLTFAVVAPDSSAQGSKAEPEPIYALDEPQPLTGSILIQKQITRSTIPLNRTYEQLSPQEKSYVHYWYEYIDEGDEPPYPAKGLLPIYKAIGHARNLAPAQGELFMAVTVDPKGRAKEVQVLKSPGKEISEFVASVLLMTKYKPAVCEGKPCQMAFPLQVEFGKSDNYTLRNYNRYTPFMPRERIR
jgi:hypothetical protein